MAFPQKGSRPSWNPFDRENPIRGGFEVILISLFNTGVTINLSENSDWILDGRRLDNRGGVMLGMYTYLEIKKTSFRIRGRQRETTSKYPKPENEMVGYGSLEILLGASPEGLETSSKSIRMGWLPSGSHSRQLPCDIHMQNWHPNLQRNLFDFCMAAMKCNWVWQLPPGRASWKSFHMRANYRGNVRDNYPETVVHKSDIQNCKTR